MYHNADMLAIRPAHRRDDVIMSVTEVWKNYEPSRIIQSPLPWLVLYATNP